MTMLPRCLLVAAALTAAASAQVQTALFTGRFPFVSTDAPNERPGGAINRLEEFDLSTSILLTGAPARTLLPATTMQCYLGDGNGDGVYTKFANWKTYFQAINVGGVFVKAADRASVSWDEVFFTVRRNAAATGSASPGALQLEVLTNNGTTPVTLVPGDYVRLRPNGNAEFFMTAAQLAVAVGAQPGAATIGAGALLQAANGDLYYAPVDGSHWVSGSVTIANANDGAIVKIDAANITYDANGNVQSFAPNSARMLVNEAAGGPGGTLTTRQMVTNSGAMSRDGTPIAATSFGKIVGLAFDPAGGTWLPMFPDAQGNYIPEPNLLFAGDAGAFAATIFSTANNGSVATINGTLCGSLTTGIPADGSWFGVQFDYPNFQPTLMGFTLCDSVVQQPMLIDQNQFGSLPLAATQPTWDVDVFAAPSTFTFLYLSLGPTGPGAAPLSVPRSFVPLPFTTESFADVFLTNGLFSFGSVLTSVGGYGTMTVPNPNTGGFTGVSVMVQGFALLPNGFELSNPLLVQLQ